LIPIIELFRLFRIRLYKFEFSLKGNGCVCPSNKLYRFSSEKFIILFPFIDLNGWVSRFPLLSTQTFSPNFPDVQLKKIYTLSDKSKRTVWKKWVIKRCRGRPIGYWLHITVLIHSTEKDVLRNIIRFWVWVMLFVFWNDRLFQNINCPRLFCNFLSGYSFFTFSSENLAFPSILP
jgi:hypothetical protein